MTYPQLPAGMSRSTRSSCWGRASPGRVLCLSSSCRSSTWPAFPPVAAQTTSRTSEVLLGTSRDLPPAPGTSFLPQRWDPNTWNIKGYCRLRMKIEQCIIYLKALWINIFTSTKRKVRVCNLKGVALCKELRGHKMSPNKQVLSTGRQSGLPWTLIFYSSRLQHCWEIRVTKRFSYVLTLILPCTKLVTSSLESNTESVLMMFCCSQSQCCTISSLVTPEQTTWVKEMTKNHIKYHMYVGFPSQSFNFNLALGMLALL